MKRSDWIWAHGEVPGTVFTFGQLCEDNGLPFDSLVDVVFHNIGTPEDREKTALVMSLWELAKAAEP